MDQAKISKMAELFRTLMGMTQQPEQSGEELLGIIARDSSWTTDELAALRSVILPAPGTTQ